MKEWQIYPAIDLRDGQVVRLAQGDPARQTVYAQSPAEVARAWLDAGASWLHVVNLDGALGERDARNQEALGQILAATAERGRVQYGGRVRNLADIEGLLGQGVARVVLGTMAVEEPALLAEVVARFGADRIAVGIDVLDNRVRLRGWLAVAEVSPFELAERVLSAGVETLIYTNIARDGVGTGVDVSTTRQLAQTFGLQVIASGGVASLADVRCVRRAGLSGVIIGRALYEGQVALADALAVVDQEVDAC